MAVFLVVFLLASQTFISPKAASEEGRPGVFGGPVDAPFGARREEAETAVLRGYPLVLAEARENGTDLNQAPGRAGFLEASVQDLSQPVVGGEYGASVSLYRVQPGDNLSGIASQFGVSLQTIINANPEVRTGLLRPGDELKILPVSGIIYKVKEGETLESIAALFNIREEKIREFNKSIQFGNLEAGISLVIPGVKRLDYPLARTATALGAADDFIMPTQGFNWGQLHHYNAVDIANSCGTPVVAAAEGLVIPDETFGDGTNGWNGGYGRFVLIEHPWDSHVRTRYAHLDKVLVEIGNYVKQGQGIGTTGRTGDATGCHLHFEVYGAENPFAK